MVSKGPPAAAWSASQAQAEKGVLALLLVFAGLPVFLYGIYLPDSPFLWLVVTTFGGCGALLPLLMRSANEATLRWDGESWHFTAREAHQLMSLTCTLDLQRWILLHVECDSGKRMWLCLKSQTMNGPWRAMRRAIAAANIQTEGEQSALPS